MKTIIAILLLTFTACVSPKEKSEKVSAQVLSITPSHDSKVGGGFMFYTTVTYRILNSENTIKKYFDIDAPELKSLSVGDIVTLKNESH